MEDPLADRMKALEAVEAGRRFDRGAIVLARIDGRSFSQWTRDLPRPFDPRLSALMVDTTRALVQETSARFGYTQSDEITLVLHADGDGSMLWFDGRIQKTVSQLAAIASTVFNHLLPEALPEKAERRAVGRLPTFDARVWTVPSRAEACEVVLWRALDATRNSVAMAARARFSHRETDRKDTGELRAMLAAAGAPWEAMPDGFRRGTMVQRRRRASRFSAEELEALPPKHAARSDPNLVVERVELVASALPRFDHVTNAEAVVFDGAEPVVRG